MKRINKLGDHLKTNKTDSKVENANAFYSDIPNM